MAVEPGTPDALARAVEQARREPFDATPQAWVQLSDSIMVRVRGSVRPGEPILVHGPSGLSEHDDRGSRTFLSARVVVDELRQMLQDHPTHAPDRIDLHIDGTRLRGVELDLVAAYGVALPPLADQLRAGALDLLRDLLGPDPDLDASAITITFVDVVPGDPR